MEAISGQFEVEAAVMERRDVSRRISSQNDASSVVLSFPAPPSPPCVVGSVAAAVVDLIHGFDGVVCSQHLPTYIDKHLINVCCPISSVRCPNSPQHPVSFGTTHSSSVRSPRSMERPIVVRWRRLLF